MSSLLENAPVKPSLTLLVIRSNFAGFHCWPDAPDEVAFLRDLHRHVFGLQVALTVAPESSRQFEFFMVQQDVKMLVENRVIPRLQQERSMSCEQLARCLAESAVQEKMAWAPYLFAISVSEDNENEAVVYFAQKTTRPPTAS